MGSLTFDDSMALGQMLDRRDSAVLDSLCRELLGQDSMDSDSLFRDITLPDVSRPPELTLPQVRVRTLSLAIATVESSHLRG